MGVDYGATVYVGAMLKESRAMHIFGAKYQEKIRDVCEKDKVPNTKGKRFCSDCGSDLRYREKITDGIENLVDLEYLELLEDNELEAYVLSRDSNGIRGAIIGKKIINKDLSDGGSVDEIKPYDDILKLKEKLSIVGIPDPVKMYLITSLSD